MTNERNWRQGEHSVGRGLPDDIRGATSWRQTTMYPPSLVTMRLDLGWYPPESVGMYAGEAWVSDTHELLALEVHPVQHYTSLEEFMERAQAWQRTLMRDVMQVEPFPDPPVAGGEPF